MNQDIFAGKWKQLKGDIKRSWGELTEDDLEQIDGHKEKLIGKLQEKYGMAKDKAQEAVDELEKSVS